MTRKLTIVFGILLLIVTAVAVRAYVSSKTETPKPVVEFPVETASPTPTSTPTPTPTPTPKPTRKPTPKPSPSPTPTPTPIPLSEIVDVYIGGQISYKDGTNTIWGQGFPSGQTTKVTDPIYWVGVYFANQGGKDARNVDVTVYLDGKQIKKSTTAELNSGANTTVRYEGGFPTEPNTTHTVRIVLNERHTFPEQTYDNNSYEFSYIRQ